MLEERRAVVRPGTIVNDAYRIVRQIGEGAMGGIYEARQLRLDKRVAIKVLARELAVNGEALLRFHREAEITSQLGHPNIITVFDFGTTDQGQPYLVMEFLEGEDLADRLHRVKTLALPAAVRVSKQVASALAETHAKGIVHRDLKPANIFLSRIQGEDFAKVLDFGISKVRAASTALTNASTLMGTPMYMAPEQAKGESELDHWTDQWALACITFEMLAGRPPFVGDDTAALLYQVVHENPPPVSQFNTTLPPAVDGVIRRALTKDQNERFPHVTAFARAFEAAATGKPIPADSAIRSADLPPPQLGQPLTPVEAAATLQRSADELTPRPAKRRSPTLTLLVGIGMTIAAGVWLVRGPMRRPPPGPTAIGPPAAPAGPVVDPLPSTPPAATAPNEAEKPSAEADEPAAVDDDTVSPPPKVTMTKKDGARRRPIRRATNMKHATRSSTGETPAQAAPVKRKLINEL
jgi:serine/threonine-protein kinase